MKKLKKRLMKSGVLAIVACAFLIVGGCANTNFDEILGISYMDHESGVSQLDGFQTEG